MFRVLQCIDAQGMHKTCLQGFQKIHQSHTYFLPVDTVNRNPLSLTNYLREMI